jgi:hypothetical protein
MKKQKKGGEKFSPPKGNGDSLEDLSPNLFFA